MGVSAGAGLRLNQVCHFEIQTGLEAELTQDWSPSKMAQDRSPLGCRPSKRDKVWGQHVQSFNRRSQKGRGRGRAVPPEDPLAGLLPEQVTQVTTVLFWIDTSLMFSSIPALVGFYMRDPAYLVNNIVKTIADPATGWGARGLANHRRLAPVTRDDIRWYDSGLGLVHKYYWTQETDHWCTAESRAVVRTLLLVSQRVWNVMQHNTQAKHRAVASAYYLPDEIWMHILSYAKRQGLAGARCFSNHAGFMKQYAGVTTEQDDATAQESLARPKRATSDWEHEELDVVPLQQQAAKAPHHNVPTQHPPGGRRPGAPPPPPPHTQHHRRLHTQGAHWAQRGVLAPGSREDMADAPPRQPGQPPPQFQRELSDEYYRFVDADKKSTRPGSEAGSCPEPGRATAGVREGAGGPPGQRAAQSPASTPLLPFPAGGGGTRGATGAGSDAGVGSVADADVDMDTTPWAEDAPGSRWVRKWRGWRGSAARRASVPLFFVWAARARSAGAVCASAASATLPVSPAGAHTRGLVCIVLTAVVASCPQARGI